ncbi:hypothetical protein QQ045_006885 [Rhodiola kirilowii]
MARALLSATSSHPYQKMDAEDPEELVHRRAQFLIYKAMQHIDKRNKPSRIRVRITKLKIKIGRRMRGLRKSLMVSVKAARACVVRQMKQLGCCKDGHRNPPRILVVL